MAKLALLLSRNGVADVAIVRCLLMRITRREGLGPGLFASASLYCTDRRAIVVLFCVAMDRIIPYYRCS